MLYDLTVLNSIGKSLIEKKQTLSVAESVTSGYLQAAFSAADNATLFFQGGITTYNYDQKFKHLQVDPLYALQNNGVSEQIADTMAEQVCKLFVCDWGIGITGYAAPIPQDNITDLYAFFSVAHKDNIVFSATIKAPKGDSIQVQLYYANEVLKAFQQVLNKT